MTKTALPLLAALALAGMLAGCGNSARNEQAEAGSTVAGDPNATMGEAVKDVDAASDQAIGGNEAGSANAADAIGDSGNEIVD
jgi:hypothetical protein